MPSVCQGLVSAGDVLGHAPETSTLYGLLILVRVLPGSPDDAGFVGGGRGLHHAI